jgi:hypothetical protein
MKSKQAVGQEQVGKRNATRELVGRWHAQRTERAKRKSLPIKADDLHAGSNKVAQEMAREKSDNVIKLAMTAVAKDMQQMFAADERIAEQQGIQRDVILQRAIAIRKNNARVTLDDEGLVPANVAYLEALEQFLMKKFDVKKVNDSISQTKRKFKTVFIAVNVGSAKRVEFHERKKEGRGVMWCVRTWTALLTYCKSASHLPS